MDSQSKRYLKETHALKLEAQLELARAMDRANAAAKQIVALYADDDLDLLSIVRSNRGMPPFTAHDLMDHLLHHQALVQLYVNHDSRRTRHEIHPQATKVA